MEFSVLESSAALLIAFDLAMWRNHTSSDGFIFPAQSSGGTNGWTRVKSLLRRIGIITGYSHSHRKGSNGTEDQEYPRYFDRIRSRDRDVCQFGRHFPGC